ncbi:MAG: C4-type zinc ribbon domain-containing protein [Nocardioidaceae bacterium]
MPRPPSGPVPSEEPTLKADPSAQLTLLEVQELDSRADQLRHQRDHLPELAEIAELRQSRQRLEVELRDARIQVEDLTAEQEKVDADVEAVKARRTRDQQRMDQGLISNPKDLERMTHELASLERRIGDLEDDEIEVMERLEEAQTRLDSLTSQAAASDPSARRPRRCPGHQDRRARRPGGRARLRREPLASGLPADLTLALYDRLRSTKAGIGAAELRARQCGGCRLSLDSAELATIKAALKDDVIRCEECQRILVRTAESGSDAVTEIRSVIIEADGGSRGNPGLAAYGAVLKNADTGEVIAEDGTTIGEATNNVAEYSGLHRRAADGRGVRPGAEIEVRSDSKSSSSRCRATGRSSTLDAAARRRGAQAGVPFGTTYVWVPRERNKHADRLANEAPDGAARCHPRWRAAGRPGGRRSCRVGRARRAAAGGGLRGWSHPGASFTAADPGALLGVTAHTVEKRFSGVGSRAATPG